MSYFADVVLDYFDSGTGPMPGPYGVTFTEEGASPIGPISLNAVLGSDPEEESPGYNFLSLPTGSYVTVGFNTGYVIDGPGNDIFIREIGPSGDRAEVWVSTSENPTTNDFVLLGIAQDSTITAFDLATLNLTAPVRAIKIVGLDNEGDSPGFDVVNVEVLQVQTATGDRILTGTDAGDSIVGGAGNDLLSGLLGNDTLNGAAGNDTLDAGEGDDLLLGNSGNDRLDGGDGDDTSSGGDGNDLLLGGWGLDRLDGGLGSDILNGAEEDDVLLGNEGLDRLDGGDGSDTLNGGDGNDVLLGNSGYDRLDGGVGDDAVNGGDDDDVLLGNLGLDRLDGGAGDDTLNGGAGNDLLLGNLGFDRLDGGAGNDGLNGGADDDLLLGNLGLDRLDGGLGNDTLNGGANNDMLLGQAGNDFLLGAAGSDVLRGGDGADILVGNQGTDMLVGGTGIDRFRFNTPTAFNRSVIGIDVVQDFVKGQDKIDLSRATFGGITQVTFASVNDLQQAQLSNATFTYIRGTGALFYNQNGRTQGFGTGGQFVDLTNGLALAAQDFVLSA